MKKISFLLLVVLFTSCLNEKQKNEIEVSDRIYNTLTNQSKCLLEYPETFTFERMKNSTVNDSISYYVMTYKYKNTYGVELKSHSYGYFDKNGIDISEAGRIIDKNSDNRFLYTLNKQE